MCSGIMQIPKPKAYTSFFLYLKVSKHAWSNPIKGKDMPSKALCWLSCATVESQNNGHIT